MKTRIKTVIIALSLMVTGTVLQAQKFGYINSQQLIASMPEVKEANSEIETLTKQLQKKGQDMLAAFQTKYKDLETKQTNGEIAPKQLEMEAAKLKEEEAQILEYERTSQDKISKKGEELFKPIQDRVNQAIQDIAAEQGYSYIFDTSLGIILYADESTDVTPLVKTKLGIQ
jgi:outer membrane protein